MFHRHFRTLLFAIVVAVSTYAGPARATTLMVLADWYTLGSIDTLLRPDSVWVARYDSINRFGYYLGRQNLHLARSDAFARTIPVNVAVADSVRVPRALVRNWYSLPKFATSDFYREMLRFEFKYMSGVHHVVLRTDQTVHVQLDSLYQSGYTAQLNDLVAVRKLLLDRCIDSLGPLDTLWLRNRSPVTNFAADMDCFNHNPFWEERGTILFQPSFPVSELAMLVDGVRVRMRPSPGFPGWYAAPRLDSSVAKTKSVQVRFDAVVGNGQRVALDNHGSPWTVAIDSGDTVWMRPDGLLANQHPDAKRPVVWIGFPTDTRLALAGEWAGFAGKPALSGWSGLPFWERPVSVWLIRLDGTRSRQIEISSTGDSIWVDGDGISTRPASSQLGEVEISARAFDFDASYNPFAEKGPDDNCAASSGGGGPTRGLVKDSLDLAGLPVWTGRVACDIGSAKDGPGNWFKPDFALLETRIAVKLWRNPVESRWSYTNSEFFPLDTVRTAPLGGHNFGFCLHFQFESRNAPDQSLKITGDDDIWLFAQKRLAIDLGGQHGPASGELDFAKLGLPDGRVVKFDLFQCERHRTGSSLGISTNALLQPVGTLAEPREPTSEFVVRPTKNVVLKAAGRRLAVHSPTGTPWSVEIRGTDGGRIFERSGIGAGEFELPVRAGVVVAKLRSAEASEAKTFFVK